MRLTSFIIFASALLAAPFVASADVIQPVNDRLGAEQSALKTARGINVEENLRNDRPAFLVRVDVDQADRCYEEGELLQVSIESEKDGYLYLLYKQADGSEKCLFPNKYDTNNRIPGGRKITIPTTTSRFNLRVAPPWGQELLVALVALKPLSGNAFGGKSLTKSVVTDIDLDTLITKGVQTELREKPAQWAEHSVQITTKSRSEPTPSGTSHKRIGLFIGISSYKDSRIPGLHICHKDAEVMAAAMKEYGKLDGIGLLTNEQATRQAIQQGFAELKGKSNAGDELFIYWSGHGATCADTNGDEADGRDELLVPYDGSPDNIEGSMIIDDELGRWIQALDGRKVCIILDACHSGGQATGKGVDDRSKGVKDAGNSKGGIIGGTDRVSSSSLNALFKDSAGISNASSGALQFGTAPLPRDFLDGELGRIKDIGQDDATMLFSSASDEISAERRDGKLSVMTYCLVEKLLASSSLTLAEAFDYLKAEVPKYMQEHFPGRTQTPQLCPESAGSKIKLR